MKNNPLSRSFIVSAILCPVSVFLFCLSRREETQSRPDTKTQSNPTASFIYNAVPENENATITPEYNTAIKTDEEGTVAYAATVTGVSGKGGIDPDPLLFNRPFVYFIRAGENGLILFAGIVNDPNISS